MSELFNEIWQSLRQNKLRTALTGLAVSWGLFMLIALLGAGNGLLNALLSNSGDVMTNSMTLWPGYRSIPYEGQKKWSEIKLTDRDVDFLAGERFRENVDDVYGRIMYSDTVSSGGYSIQANVMGTAPLAFRVDKLHLVTGRFINGLDMKERRKVAVIYSDMAEDIMGKAPASGIIGKNVKVGNLLFQVVGILDVEDGAGGYPRIMLPLTTVKAMRHGKEDYSRLVMSFHGLETEEDNDAFEASLRQAMNFRHNAAPNDDSTLYISNRKTQNMAMNTAIRVIRTALWILGIFTLLSGIVGVSNIMMITVKERIHEFGIRKALGATPWSIMALIVTESIIVTAFFGYLGMVAGLFANYIMDITIAAHPVDMGVVQIYMFKNPSVGIDVALKATLLIIIAGTAAGMIPALKAARVRPIEALRRG